MLESLGFVWKVSSDGFFFSLCELKEEMRVSFETVRERESGRRDWRNKIILIIIIING